MWGDFKMGNFRGIYDPVYIAFLTRCYEAALTSLFYSFITELTPLQAPPPPPACARVFQSNIKPKLTEDTNFVLSQKEGQIVGECIHPGTNRKLGEFVALAGQQVPSVHNGSGSKRHEYLIPTSIASIPHDVIRDATIMSANPTTRVYVCFVCFPSQRRVRP